MSGIFAWAVAEKPPERMARLWLEYNGLYLLWPYIRSYIATVTGLSDLPQLTIYTMNVPDRPDIDEESSEKAAESITAP